MLLFPDEQRGVAQTRVFDFSPEGFPYGSLQLVNFTSSRIAISIDGTSFVANSRATARYPKLFNKRTACSFKMAVAEPNGEQKLLKSTIMILRPTARMLLFAFEVPGAEEDGKYRTELIIDNIGVKPQVVEAPAPGPKGKAAPQPKGKKGAPAPQPEAPL